MNPKTANKTAEYAEYAERDGVGDRMAFTGQMVSSAVRSRSISAYSAYSAVSIAVSRMNVFVPMLLLAAACNRNAPPPAPVSIEQVPATVASAFKDAPADAKSIAQEVATEVQAKDDGKALMQLQTLFQRPDLTPEQREAASRSMISLNLRLREAAAQGDTKAAEALQAYQAGK
jgi:hypothetical protein